MLEDNLDKKANLGKLHRSLAGFALCDRGKMIIAKISWQKLNFRSKITMFVYARKLAQKYKFQNQALL
jgi:hypothetical protein